MGIVPQQLAPQNLYFDILLSAVIISLLRCCLSSFFPGIGRTRIVMLASLAAMNVLANYLLVFGKCGLPAMGIRGAAVGTIIGGACGLLILGAAYFGKVIRDEYHVMRSFRFDGEMMHQLFRFGSPTGCEMFLNMLAFDAIVMTFHSAFFIRARPMRCSRRPDLWPCS